MKHMKKLILLAAVCTMVFAGCGKSEGEETAEEVVTTETVLAVEDAIVETETEEAVTDPGNLNPLTGEQIDPKLVNKRPVACMIGNTVDAMPQYGTSNADILYEAPAEGGLTRLMGIFKDYENLPTIMSVRSCRSYYANFANEFEAIYIHYGQAIYATELVKNRETLNGLDGDLANVTFFRDNSRKSPHNAYVNGESIVAGIKKRGYRTEHADTYKQRYTFASSDQQLENGVDAKVVAPGYSVNKPWFVYNEETGLYERFQYKAPHVDGANNEQLAFKNVIFQVCDYEIFPDGSYLDVKTASYGGAGKYISNGKAIDIGWIKEVEDGVGKYYDTQGNEIKLNPGKTCVCIVLNDATDHMGIYATEEEFEASK